MGNKFNIERQTPVIPKLNNVKEKPFRMAIERKLDNGYEVKDLSTTHIQELHRFVAETVYKNLSVSAVDKKYLRTKGSKAPKLKIGDRELIHYGRDASAFRIFGYYNEDGYFVICRIDGDHKTHKQ